MFIGPGLRFSSPRSLHHTPLIRIGQRHSGRAPRHESFWLCLASGCSPVGERRVTHSLRDTGLVHGFRGKDIACSNSMIEAVNKTLKYRHLFPFPMPDAKGLERCIAKAIDDYNCRPHSCLKTLTPNEVHGGKVFDTKAHQALLEEARLKRMEINRRSCPPCAPLKLESPEWSIQKEESHENQ